MKNVLLLALCFALSFLTCGQLVAQYQFTLFDESTGLPDQVCRGMAVDSAGTLWVGTQEGLAKWDGTSFIHVPIDDGVTTPFVSTVKVAPDGNIWVGYLTLSDNLGLSVIDTDGNLLLHADAELSGEAGTWVFDIEFGPDGLVYVAHLEGISIYDGSEWEIQTPASDNFAAAPVFDLHFAQDQSLWVATTFGLAHRQTEGIWENFYTLSSNLVHDNVRTLEFDNAGQLWIGTSDGLSVYDGEDFENYGIAEGLPNSFLRDIAFDAEGQTWLMTDDGFSVFDGQTFQNFRTDDSPFVDNRINNVLIDPELGTWLTTSEGMVLVSAMVSSAENNFFEPTAQVQVFPNPTSGLVHLSNDQGILRAVSVFSSQGQLLQQFETQAALLETTLDLSSLPAGTYGLHIETSNGLLTRKVVKR